VAGALVLALVVLLLVGTARGMTAAAPYTGSTPDEFVAWIGPHARDGHRRHGVPASVTIAQAALESGWGRSELAKRAANLFGIKAGSSWRGRVISATTREYVNGEWVTVPGAWKVYPTSDAAVAAGLLRESLFRVYPSPLEGLADHARVLYNGRYAAALAVRTDPEAFAHALTGVYATDPAYGEKLVGTMRARNLTAWDVPPASWALDPGVVPPEYRA
jgi:flagellar protein FlgJ